MANRLSTSRGTLNILANARNAGVTPGNAGARNTQAARSSSTNREGAWAARSTANSRAQTLLARGLRADGGGTATGIRASARQAVGRPR